MDVVQLPPEISKITVTKLMDSLGSVSVTLPLRYDTSFSWTNHSDCGKPCDKIEYRMQPKSLKITKETGWFWLGEPKDSIERFTIIHSGYFPFRETDDTSVISKFHQYQKAIVVESPNSHKIKSDTVEKIGDRYFSIITIDLFDTTKQQFSKKLLAATTIKSSIISFNFELLTKDKSIATDKFIDNSKYYLQTIRLSNGK